MQPASIRQQLSKIISKNSIVELRAFKPMVSGFFDNGIDLEAAATQLSGTCPAVYFTINPVLPDSVTVEKNKLIYGASSNTLTSDAKIQSRRWLFVDIDPIRPADCSSTDAEHTEAIEKAKSIRAWLSAQGWPLPILADSGNGAHLLYRVDLPNDDAAKLLIRTTLAGLAERFDTEQSEVDRKVYNASRICKLYGTMAQKGDNTEDRPHRLSGLLEVPDSVEIVTAEQLAAIKPAPAQQQQQPAPAPARQNKYALTALDDAIRKIQNAQPGTRNDTLNLEAFGIAQLCAGGELQESMAFALIEQAAIACGMDAAEIKATLRSAFESGRSKPRNAPQATRSTNRQPDQDTRNIDPETGEILPPHAAPAELLPEPIDIFCVKKPPRLTLDYLPECFVDYVADQSDLLGCDHSIIGMAAIVSAAACITDGIKLQPKRHDPTWRESARLWLAIVGDPSTRKSPAIAKAVRNVKRLDGVMCEGNARKAGAYQHAVDEWKTLNKDAKKSGTPLAAPEKPRVERLLVEDTTVEALSEILKDNPRGVLCLKDELTGWFASMDAYKGSKGGASMDRAHWLEAYNGGRRSIDRVMRGSVIIPNWSACMIGGIQDEMIRQIAGTMGHDGLLQRFMVVCAHPSVKDADRTPNMRAMDEYKAMFDKLERLQADDMTVTMTEEAHACRERVSDYSRKLIAALDHPHMQAWLGKWDGLYARLVLLYHVIDCVANDLPPARNQVSGAIAGQVEHLMCGFLLPHAIYFYTEILDANKQMETTRQLARFILAKKLERLTRRDMAQYWKASRSLEDWELQKIINTLCNYDWLQPDEQSIGSDGKPKAWRVNYRVHEVFENYAQEETKRRKDVTATIRDLKEFYGGQQGQQ